MNHIIPYLQSGNKPALIDVDLSDDDFDRAHGKCFEITDPAEGAYNYAPDAPRSAVKFRRRPLLTAEEERDLFRQWQGEKNEAARTTLVECFQPLVNKIAAKYSAPRLRFEEKVSFGNEGLLRAIDKFDLARGTRFATLAQYWVRAIINEGARNAFSIVRRPQGEGVQSDFSLNTSISDSPDAEDFQSLLADDENPLEDLTAFRIENVKSSLDTLDRRQRRIIEARWFEREPATLDQLGAELGISRERVRQVEGKSFAKLYRADAEKKISTAAFAREITLNEFCTKGNALSRSLFMRVHHVALSAAQNRARIKQEDGP